MFGRPPFPSEGLYDGQHEHDACGVAFVATLTGEPSHDIVAKALTALRNLEHRGASGAEPDSGDGAGILIQIPDAFYRKVCEFELPVQRGYATGIAFLPAEADDAAKAIARIEELAAEENLEVLGWRDVPTDPDLLGATARSVMPTFKQLFVAAKAGRVLGLALERMAFRLRKRAEKETETYFPSLSGRTITYKGMLTTDQLDKFFPELTDPDFASAIGVVHSRFSTNTFPSWPLAHPYRYIAHNGEINTVQGNRNWMRAREALLSQRPDPRRPRAALPDLYAERVGLGLVRRGPGAPAPGRPFAPARDADDDPGGVGERHHDGSEAARVLRVPLDADGAVGRPGVGGLLRRHQGRRGPGPQRSPAVALLGHRGRSRRTRVRGRRPRHRPGDRDREGPARARPDLPGRRRGAPDHHRLRGEERARHRAPVRRMAARRPDPVRGPARARARRPQPRVGDAPPASVRVHRGRAARHPHPDGEGRRRADRLDGHRHADRRTERPAAAAVRLLRPAVRAGHQPAAGRDPRRARHLAVVEPRPGGEPAQPEPGVLPSGGDPVPGDHQRRAGQAPPHQPRRRHAGPGHHGPARRVRRRGRRRGAEGTARRDLRRGRRGDQRTAPASWCCPTGTRTPTARRSRRCC